MTRLKSLFEKSIPLVCFLLSLFVCSVFFIIPTINEDELALAFRGIGGGIALFLAFGVLTPLHLTPQHCPRWIFKVKDLSEDKVQFYSYHVLLLVVALLIAAGGLLGYFFFTPSGEFFRQERYFLPLLLSLFLIPFCLWQLIVDRPFVSKLTVDQYGVSITHGAGSTVKIWRNDFLSASVVSTGIKPRIIVRSKGKVDKCGPFSSLSTQKPFDTAVINGELFGYIDPDRLVHEIESKMR